MAALTPDDLDGMTAEETEVSLRLMLAYAKMETLVQAIISIYEYDDRQEIAESISEPASDEDDDSSNDDDC